MSRQCCKSRWAVLLAVALCTGCRDQAPHGARLVSPCAAAAPSEPDYRAEVRRYVPTPLAGTRPNFVDRIAQGPLRGFCEEMAVAARLWQGTGRAEYAEEACQRLTALVDVWELQHQPGKPWRRVCFFSACPIIDAYRVLRGGGQLDAEFQRRFRGFAREAYFAQEEGTFNQAFARAAGLAWAAKTLPDLPEADAWRQSAEAVWNQWREQRDMSEDAAAYNGIALTYLFLLADALDHNQQLQDPLLRPMFDRFRDQVSPWGAMPEYGDSGDAEWGMFHAWGAWVCALERAGALFHDAGYRWAAVRMFHAARQRASASPALDAMTSAYALCLADQWRNPRLTPRPTAAASAVSLRREPGGEAAADKLLLAPSRQPGAPLAMTELFARGYHAHDDQLGALLYYEYRDVPLLHGLGYHNRAAQQANLLFLCPATEPFPHAEKGSGVFSPAGESQKKTPDPFSAWHEAALPAKRLPPAGGAADRHRRHFDKLTFRVAEDEPVDLTVADLRLSGPKGELLLDDFAGRRRWHGGRQERVAGSVPGRTALKAQLRGGTSFLWCDGLDTTFSLQDYDHFKFSWKIEGVEEGWSNSLIFRVDRAPTDFHVALRPLGAEITAAGVAARGGDQYGQFRAADWFTAETRLWRRMVLLAEGPLVVCDRLEPGPAAAGWQAGPLWHLRALPQSGANWYNAPGSEELLVWFGPSPGRTCGVQSVALWSGTKPSSVFTPFTVFAKETLKAGRAVQFVSVLLPHAPPTPAAELAAAVRTASSPDGAVTVELPAGGKNVRVRLAPDGTWNVSR
jgi:hypothetical protein